MAKKIELSTVKEEEASTRWLTTNHLVVDWSSYGDLFFRMTKSELRGILDGEERANTKSILRDGVPKVEAFDVKRTKTTLSIGCERFNAKDLKLMRKWCGAA